MEQKIARMKELLEERLNQPGIVETGVAGVTIFRRDEPFARRSQLYPAQLILLAQGRKNVFWGGRRCVYDPQHYYVQTVPLPVECEAVIEDGRPMLGMVIKIDPQIIGELLSSVDLPPTPAPTTLASVYNAVPTAAIVDAVVRLLECLRSANETRVLGPVYLKEILFRVLNGENGDALQQLALSNRGFSQVARAINRIHEEYSRPLEIQTLAREAGMSSTAFYTLFKSLTSTSPLQYLKNIRLHKAKDLIQLDGERAYEAALRVGYESASQFSREYKRCFGLPPTRDRHAVAVD